MRPLPVVCPAKPKGSAANTGFRTIPAIIKILTTATTEIFIIDSFECFMIAPLMLFVCSANLSKQSVGFCEIDHTNDNQNMRSEQILHQQTHNNPTLFLRPQHE